MITIYGSFNNGEKWSETASDGDEFRFVISKLRGNGAVSSFDSISIESDEDRQVVEDFDSDDGSDLESLIQ